MPSGKHLTEKEVKRLLELHNKGYPSMEIAKRLGITRHTVVKRLRRYGIRKSFKYFKRPKIKLPKEHWKVVYLAGIIDGEGTINYIHDNRPEDDPKKSRTRVSMAIINSSERLIEFIEQNFGGSFKSREAGEGHLGKKPLYIWTIEGTLDVWIVLNAIFPYLVVRKNKAKEALDYLEWRLKRGNYIGYANELLSEYLGARSS